MCRLSNAFTKFWMRESGEADDRWIATDSQSRFLLYLEILAIWLVNSDTQLHARKIETVIL